MLRFAHLMWNAFLSTIIDVCKAMILTAPSPAEASKDLKLICCDPHSPDAHAVKNTLRYGDIDFEDSRVTGAALDDKDDGFSRPPLLYIGEEDPIKLSTTVLRYVSKLSRTYSSNPYDAAVIDQWVELHTDFRSLLAFNMHPENYGLSSKWCYDRNAHHKYIVETHIPKHLAILENELRCGDESWLGKMDALSMADIAWYSTLDWLRGGGFDGVDNTTLSKYPSVYKHMKEVEEHLWWNS